MTKNYGFIIPRITNREEGSEHLLGSLDDEGTIINPRGVWEWLNGEEQRKRGIETFACTVFATLRAIETEIKFKTGINIDYSSRYLANIAYKKGILNPQVGADPHKIAELIRTIAGCLGNDRAPWSDEIKTADDYYALKDIAELMKEGERWFDEWELRHRWVWIGNQTPQEKQKLLKIALTKGTVCVSVVAWQQRNGLYYKEIGERDGHWTGLERYEDELPIVEDSYPESEGDFEKVLESNYDFGIAKVYYLKKKIKVEETKKNRFINWFRTLKFNFN